MKPKLKNESFPQLENTVHEGENGKYSRRFVKDKNRRLRLLLAGCRRQQNVHKGIPLIIFTRGKALSMQVQLSVFRSTSSEVCINATKNAQTLNKIYQSQNS